MKKLLLLILSIGLSQLSYADYLDDWPDNALCEWMENPSTPSYMVKEVKTRGIICSGGNVIKESAREEMSAAESEVLYDEKNPPVPTQRPDMFSTAVVKYATTVTAWAEMGIPADITKKYLNDPTAGGTCDHECMTLIPTAASEEAKAEAVAAAEAASKASAAAVADAVTQAQKDAKAALVAANEAASKSGAFVEPVAPDTSRD